MSDRSSASRHKQRKSKRNQSSENDQVLDTILSKLRAIEDRLDTPPPPEISIQASPRHSSTPLPPLLQPPHEIMEQRIVAQPEVQGVRSSAESEHSRATSTGPYRAAPAADVVTERIVNALSSFAQARPTHYYISSFDPQVHNFDVWCAEVDKARESNRWTDNECLSRVAGCLKGDARLWLSDWVTNDRSWTNFKLEFRSLCPRNIDVANILFEVMCTDSKNYATYANYARSSLLRLNIVTGLSDELKTAIIIRGITDPQIRAAATNAKLKPLDIVEFLSVFAKPKLEPRATHDPARLHKPSSVNFRKRDLHKSESRLTCFKCGGTGHKRVNCFKKPRIESTIENEREIPSTNNVNQGTPLLSASKRPVVTCTYCHKNGHTADICFAKQRAETNNRRSSNVNLCRKQDSSNNSGIMTAVVEGVPVDVLIDSGSCISLVSESVLKHINGNKLPTYRALRGIGSQEIECTSYIVKVIEFADISIEVDLYVVPETCMCASILIGTDVLNRDGVTYIRTGEVQRLMRIEEPAIVQSLRDSESNIKTSVTGDEKHRLHSLINEFSQFFISGTASSTVTTGSMEITLNSDTPVNYRPYKLSHDEKLRVRGIIKDLLDKGVIRESNSEFASPIILVKKKDGTDRMCVDYRALNAITIKNRFPLPLIEDHIDRLGKAMYFSSLDMATGFHQIKMDPNSVKKTAFVTPEGHFEYLKMPYGLANAPVVYQRIISGALKPLIESGKVLVYIDDVLILSETIDEGLDMLRQVLTVLTTAGFSINLKKCNFLATEIEYLGRLISRGQVRPSPRKVEALINSSRPKNVKQIRQLLGLAGYFRRYIAGYSMKTACIARLTKRGVPFIWGSEQEEARAYLIRCLTDEPVLAIFDPNLSTELHTDASAIGYGAVLLQEHEAKKRRVVAYFSRATQGAEPKYHSYELETLAIIKALQHFRHYLIGITFKIVTDCNSLKLTERKKDLIPRVARWWVYMQDFSFNIEYRKGALMPHADYLSRNPAEVMLIRRPTNWAQQAQAADSETQNLIDKLNQGQLDSTRYEIRNNLLYYNYSATGEDNRLLCFIPKGYRLSLLRIFHDEHDHIGIDKTTDLILKHFWFPCLRHFVRKYINHCLICLTHKRVPRAPHQPIESWTKPDNPFLTVHMDVLGPLPESKGFKYVLVAVDAFSKYCLLYALYRQDAEELKRAFTNTVSLFGTPLLVVNDRGRMFESETFKKWLTELGCASHFITPEMHHENGQAERYCRTVLNLLRVEVNNKGSEWSDALWKIQLILNMTKNATTQLSPLQLLVGVDATTPVLRSLVRDVALNSTGANREALVSLRRQRANELLAANQRRQDDVVNEGRKQPRIYKVGDLGFVIKSSQSKGKLDSGMRGPYKVVRVLPHDRYELELISGSYGKRTQAASQYMIPWRGEWTPETCAAFFECKCDWLDIRTCALVLLSSGIVANRSYATVATPCRGRLRLA